MEPIRLLTIFAAIDTEELSYSLHVVSLRHGLRHEALSYMGSCNRHPQDLPTWPGTGFTYPSLEGLATLEKARELAFGCNDATCIKQNDTDEANQ